MGGGSRGALTWSVAQDELLRPAMVGLSEGARYLCTIFVTK